MVEKLSLVIECARQILGMDLSKTGQFKIIDLSMGLALYCAQMKLVSMNREVNKKAEIL